MQEFLIVLDYSKSDLIEGLYYFRPFLEEIGKRIGLSSWIDVRYLLPEEVETLLLNHKTTTEMHIARRKENYLCVLKDNHIAVSFGSEAREHFTTLVEPSHTYTQTKEFSGMVAFPGKVETVNSSVSATLEQPIN